MTPEQAEILIQNSVSAIQQGQYIVQAINLGCGLLVGLIFGVIFFNQLKEMN